MFTYFFCIFNNNLLWQILMCVALVMNFGPKYQAYFVLSTLLLLFMLYSVFCIQLPMVISPMNNEPL